MLMVSEDQADPEVTEIEEEDTGYIPTPKEVCTQNTILSPPRKRYAHSKYMYCMCIYLL